MNDEPMIFTIVKNVIVTVGAIAISLFWLVVLLNLFN